MKFSPDFSKIIPDWTEGIFQYYLLTREKYLNLEFAVGTGKGVNGECVVLAVARELVRASTVKCEHQTVKRLEVLVLPEQAAGDLIRIGDEIFGIEN